MAKDKKTIKYEADISSFNKNIQSAESKIKTLNNTLKLNQEQLKGSGNSTQLLSDRLTTLKEKYEQQSTVVDNTRKKYEKAVEVYGENSKEAENLKNKLIQAETKQQSIANAISKTNEQLEIQTNKFINNGKKLEEFGEKANNLGDKLDKTGNKLSVLSAGITAVVASSVKASISFESAWTGVTKTVDGTEEQMKNLRDGIIELSTQLPSTTEEIAEVAEGAGQLGIQTDNVLEFTKTMINMGNATNLSADEAATTLARFANVTKMSQNDFDKLGSVIVALGNNFETTEAEISEMGMNLASAGTQVGMTQSDIMALATALSSVGLEAQAGGTAFSKVMVNMQLAVEKGGKDLQNFASVAGMSTKEFKKAFKEDATNAIMQFVDGLSKSEERGKSAIRILDDMGITETRLRDALLRSANASTVMSEAIDLGSKAWDENIALTEEADKRYGTTEAKLKMLKNGVKASAIQLGDDLKPALIDVLEQAKPIISSINSTVKAFNKLDDKTRKHIINLGAMAIASGPVVKASGKIITSVGNTTKTIGTLSQAIGFMGKTSTTEFAKASTSVQSLTKVFTAISSPIGLATAATTIAAGAMIYFATQESEAQKEANELSKKTLESKNALQQYNEEIDKATNSDLAHIDTIKNLKDELTQLVDENGKVKDGYKGRVDFILNELNGALGTEYELNGDIIQNYKDLQNEIDSTIEKKKAEILLNAEQEKYKNAIENQKQAVEELKEIQEKLGMSYDEVREKYGKYIDKINSNTLTVGDVEEIGSTAEYKKIRELAELSNAYENTEWKVQEYTNDIKKYEEDYANFTEEKYNEIGKIITATTQDWSDKTLQELQISINEQENSLGVYKKIYERTGNDIALQLSQQAQENLYNLAEELKARTSAIGHLGEDEKEAWKNLASESYEAYATALSDMGPTQRKEIEEITGAIVMGTPETVEKASELAQKTINEFDKSPEAKQNALNTLIGYLNGLDDESKRKLLEQAGIEDVDLVLEQLNRGDLSEENGRNILEGLWKGLQNGNWQGKILGAASGLAKAVNKAFTGKDGWDEHSPSKKMKKFTEYYIQPISDVMKAQKSKIVSTAQQLAQKVNSVFDNKVSVPSLQSFGGLHSMGNNQIVETSNTSYTINNLNIYPQKFDTVEILDEVNTILGKKY